MPGYWWTESEIEILRELYPHYRAAYVKQFLPNRSVMSIGTKATRLGIEKSINGSRKYLVNDDFFACNSPISAYWAGFIAADGCIHEDSGTVSVRLSVKDEKHLQNLKAELCPAKPLSTSGKFVCLAVRSEQIVLDLLQIYNITPRKSLTLVPPNLLDEDMIIAYIAGLIDGDGTISSRTIKFLGTYELLDWVRSYFLVWDSRIKAVVSPKENICRLTVGFGRVQYFTGRVKKLKLPVLKRKWKKIRPLRSRKIGYKFGKLKPNNRQFQALKLKKRGMGYCAIARQTDYRDATSVRRAIEGVEKYLSLNPEKALTGE